MITASLAHYDAIRAFKFSYLAATISRAIGALLVLRRTLRHERAANKGHEPYYHDIRDESALAK